MACASSRPTRFRHLALRFVLAASVLSSSGCCMGMRSSDAALSESLQLWLRASTGYYSSDTVSFELFYNSADKSICPGGRRIVVTANGNRLPDPRSWSLTDRFAPVHRETRRGYRRCLLWHMSPSRLSAWLGGSGRYSIQVRVGPVATNSVDVECMPDGRVEILDAGGAPCGAHMLSSCPTGPCDGIPGAQYQL